MLAHSVQTTLCAPYYRRMDPLLATSIRGLSLAVSMSPLLLLSAPGTAARLGEHGWLLGFACFVTACANWAAAQSMRYYQVAVAAALQQAWLNMAAISLGILLFDEVLYPAQYFAVALIVVATFILGSSVRSDASRIAKANPLAGLLCTGAFGILVAIGTSLMSKISRELDPYVAAYSWEVGIGVAALLMYQVKPLAGLPANTERLGLRDMIAFSAAAAPTAVGTGCYAAAVTLGPFPVVAAVVSTLVLASAVWAALLLNEHLSSRQWLAVLLGTAAVIMLNVAR